MFSAVRYRLLMFLWAILCLALLAAASEDQPPTTPSRFPPVNRLRSTKHVRFVPGAPMRFTQFVCLVMSAGCTAAAFRGRFGWMLGLLSALLFFSFLWCACNICVVCKLYL